MTWTGKLWKFGTTPDDIDMTALQADITAQAAGDSGAPKSSAASMDTNSVGTTALAAGAVSQAKMPTAQGSITIALGNNILSDWAILPGGSYGFYPEVRVSTNNASAYICFEASELDPPFDFIFDYFSSTTYATTIGAGTSNQIRNFNAQQRYVQASPPYDLGDGLCHRFTFCQINKTTGAIEGVWTAPDAPWHNNGPTDIRAARKKFVLVGDGFDHRKLYADARHIRRLIAIGGDLTDAQLMRLQEWFEVSDILDKASVTEDVPQLVKNADMALIPHPFSALRQGSEIVLLDPMADISVQLNEIEDDLDEYLSQLFSNGFFKINNKELARVSPPGVKTVSYRWK
jgi:hypothetical protein